MFCPVVIESLPNCCPIAIRLEAVVRSQEHEEGFANLCSILNLPQQLLTIVRDDHAFNTARSVWFDPDRSRQILRDPL